MDRREFMKVAGAGMTLGASRAADAAQRSSPPAPTDRKAAPAVMMKVGTQHDSSDETLAILAAFGVNNICSRLPSARFDDDGPPKG